MPTIGDLLYHIPGIWALRPKTSTDRTRRASVHCLARLQRVFVCPHETQRRAQQHEEAAYEPPTPPREDNSTPNGKEIGHSEGHEQVSSLRHEFTAHSLMDLTSFTPMQAAWREPLETDSSALDDARKHMDGRVQALSKPLAHREPAGASKVQRHPRF
ncbi:hypothetical protein BD311DRAFT_810003 [Dichomitus squalens]|uniref:Uncharacterized protein n=1 Tax=Dichomitus squalens TaxID=114155 RepID=A0A4Q9MDF1_9APHY|nr:hypothetical protein BD311DRAFT_810003 [Dichomitus squalens]